MSEERNYTRADLLGLAERIYEEAGGKARLMERARGYAGTAPAEGPIHNYYYVYQDVFDYADLNATLGRAAVFLAGGEKALPAGRDLVELLCCLADSGYLIDHTFCDRAFDGYTTQLLVHAWLQVREAERFSAICSDEERERVEGWFHHRARRMYNDREGETWATFRPYDNQEIGVGACVLLAELLRERDPELARGLLEVADSRLIGWERKNGNLDDTLFYTPILAKVLYFHGVYRPCPGLLRTENCRQTFEGMLQQQNGAGIFPLYNWTQYASTPEMMALGARLFHDGRYKWMANRLLQERLERRPERIRHAARGLSPQTAKAAAQKGGDAELWQVVAEELGRVDRYDQVWEGLTDNIFHLWFFWDDGLEPERPREGSQVLEKSAGQGRWPHDPEPVLPDKVVLRQGWGEGDLTALLNLWGGQNSPAARTVSHRYPASNELISLVCGEQFLVQNTDQVTRDVHIQRGDLNAFNLRREGRWLSAPTVMYNPEGRTFGIYPDLRLYNAELRTFGSFPGVDGVKATLYEYHGWTNERTLLLLGDTLLVFDQSFGPGEETGGTRWHLQGEVVEQTEQSLRLKLLDSGLEVLFPHKERWLSVEAAPNTRPIPIYQHHADLDLDLVSTGSRMGALTVFRPARDGACEICLVEVTCGGHPAHPNAMGVRLGGRLAGCRLGMYRDEYDYGGFRTDAAAFVLDQEGENGSLTVFDARSLRLPQGYTRVEPGDGIACAAHIQERGGARFVRFAQPVTGVLRLCRG